MNRSVISIGALGIVLTLASMAFAQTPTQNPTTRDSNATSQQPQAGVRQQYQRLRQQIDELKAAHQELITQLQAIHAVAVKEKATETAGQIQTMIDKRQEAFQNTLQRLEQQQLQLQTGSRTRTPRVRATGQAPNKQAPDFELSSFNGKHVKLSDYKGKIVVLEWINLECPFSMYHHEKTNTMVDLAKKYRDKGVVWFAVNSTGHTTVEANRDFVEKQKLPYPILDDRSGQVGRLYGARNTPHMFVIDKTGAIAYEGAIDNAPLGKQEPGAGSINYVDKAISELLAKQKVSTPVTPPYGCSVKYAAPVR